ncbi:hypothetical protein ACGF5O_44170 [Streptomyces sp. NPDC048291]|uniref:hypothetical protein n=1 Tax=Streptomyces sp. NPDC048291 TaxID=3365530 RepID=UPI00371E1531
MPSTTAAERPFADTETLGPRHPKQETGMSARACVAIREYCARSHRLSTSPEAETSLLPLLPRKASAPGETFPAPDRTTGSDGVVPAAAVRDT